MTLRIVHSDDRPPVDYERRPSDLILAGLDEALRHSQGEATGREHRILVRQVRSSDLALSQLRFAAAQHRQHMRDLIAIGAGALAAIVFVGCLFAAGYFGWL